MAGEVSCVVPPWGSYVVPVVRHRRLGGTTLASVKNESVAKCGRIYYGMFSFFQWMREIKMVVACHEVLPSGYGRWNRSECRFPCLWNPITDNTAPPARAEQVCE